MATVGYTTGSNFASDASDFFNGGHAFANHAMSIQSHRTHAFLNGKASYFSCCCVGLDTSLDRFGNQQQFKHSETSLIARASTTNGITSSW